MRVPHNREGGLECISPKDLDTKGNKDMHNKSVWHMHQENMDVLQASMSFVSNVFPKE